MTAIGLAVTLAAGCSSTSPGGGEKEKGVDLSSIKDGYLGTDKKETPVDGGALTMASFSEPRSLEPAVTIAALTTGGTEMLNDNITWTLSLRDGVLFSDGTTFDAAAVKGWRLTSRIQMSGSS